MSGKLATQPPPTPAYLLSYPAPHVLLITINRPQAMNSLPYASHWEADALLQWFDSEPSLRVAVITGVGKAFCAGQDLIEQRDLTDFRERKARGEDSAELERRLDRRILTHPPSGFMGVSRRTGKKPVIAAVNGFAMGGGFEICLGWYVRCSAKKRKKRKEKEKKSCFPIPLLSFLLDCSAFRLRKRFLLFDPHNSKTDKDVLLFPPQAT